MAKIIAKTEITISRIVDIESVTRYYLLQSSTAAAPSKPTTNPPVGSWQTTEPSYVSGSTNTLYFSDCTVMTNGAFSYSAVSKSSSYEAAKEAWNKANNAQESIDNLEIGGRNLLRYSSLLGESLACDVISIMNTVTSHSYETDGFHLVTPSDGNGNNGVGFCFFDFENLGIYPGDTITLSADIKGISDSNKPFLSIHFAGTSTVWWGTGTIVKSVSFAPESRFKRVSVSITLPSADKFTNNKMWLAIHGNHQSDLYIRNLKLELGNKATDWTPAPEDVNSSIDDVIGSYQKDLLDQRTEILKEVDEIVLTAGADYVVKDDYSKYQETVESKFTQMEDGIKMDFSTSREQLNELNKALADTKTEWAKYIRFSDDGIEIGDTDNILKLEIDNDMIRFTKNGITTGWWDGNNFHTGNIVVEVNERAQFGNFAFVPRSDGSLSFLKVGD